MLSSLLRLSVLLFPLLAVLAGCDSQPVSGQSTGAGSSIGSEASAERGDGGSDLVAEAPVEVDQGGVEDLGRSVVLIADGSDAGSRPRAGIVFRQEAGVSYVVALLNLRTTKGADGRLVDIVPNGPFHIMWDNGDERVSAEATRVAILRDKRRAIFSAPSEQLPPAVAIRKGADPEPGRDVWVTGYTMDNRVTETAYRRACGKAVFADFRRRETDVFAPLEGESLAGMMGGLVVSEHGRPMGFFLGNTSGNKRARGGYKSSHFQLIQDLAALAEPEFVHQAFAAYRGDRRQADYQFVVCAVDPFNQLREPTLLVSKEMIDSSYRARKLPDGTWARMEYDPVELALKKSPPLPEVRKQLPELERVADAPTWVAQRQTANPGPVSRQSYIVQVAFDRGDGTEVYTRPVKVAYVPRMIENMTGYMPAIPGFDGRPLAMPMAKRREDGGWLITEEATQVAPAESAAVNTEFPSPQASGRQLAAEPVVEDGIRRVALPIPMNRSGRGDEASLPMVFSPNGESFYLIEKSRVLRKFNGSDFTEEVTLDLGEEANDLAFSKAGLLVPVGRRALWVLSPDTLEVIREIPVAGARVAAGSLQGDVGFVHATIKDVKGRTSTPNQVLSMIDLAKGKVLHEIKDQYSYLGRGGAFQSFQIDGNSVVCLHPAKFLTMDREGRRLFISNNMVWRFDLEGNDLIFREMGRPKDGKNRMAHMAYSAGGAKFAVPVPVASASNGIAVYDADGAATSMALSVDASCIDFDPVTQNIFAATREGAAVLDPQGDEIARIPMHYHGRTRLLAHPKGNGFVMWMQDELVFVDVAQMPGK